jgi:hypothetical protein
MRSGETRSNALTLPVFVVALLSTIALVAIPDFLSVSSKVLVVLGFLLLTPLVVAPAVSDPRDVRKVGIIGGLAAILPAVVLLLQWTGESSMRFSFLCLLGALFLTGAVSGFRQSKLLDEVRPMTTAFFASIAVAVIVVIATSLALAGIFIALFHDGS